MSRWRLIAALAVVAVLAVLLVVALTGGDDGPPAVPTTTPPLPRTIPLTPATTLSEEPPTTTAEQRRAEVTAILQENYFRWFDAIYRQDADALWEVVATSRAYEDGVNAMGAMAFLKSPSQDEVAIQVRDLLLDRPDCLVVYFEIDVTAFRGAEAVAQAVDVLWPTASGDWRFATSWSNPDDLWLDDCDLLEREDTPR